MGIVTFRQTSAPVHPLVKACTQYLIAEVLSVPRVATVTPLGGARGLKHSAIHVGSEGMVTSFGESSSELHLSPWLSPTSPHLASYVCSVLLCAHPHSFCHISSGTIFFTMQISSGQAQAEQLFNAPGCYVEKDQNPCRGFQVPLRSDSPSAPAVSSAYSTGSGHLASFSVF